MTTGERQKRTSVAKVNGSYQEFAEALHGLVCDATEQAMEQTTKNLVTREELDATLDERFSKQRENIVDDIKDILTEQSSDI